VAKSTRAANEAAGSCTDFEAPFSASAARAA
jgi:hypothetical protein